MCCLIRFATVHVYFGKVWNQPLLFAFGSVWSAHNNSPVYGGFPRVVNSWTEEPYHYTLRHLLDTSAYYSHPHTLLLQMISAKYSVYLMAYQCHAVAQLTAGSRRLYIFPKTHCVWNEELWRGRVYGESFKPTNIDINKYYSNLL